MDKVCPRCGAKSSEKKFIENFCVDCFRTYIDVDTPASIDIPVCRTCGKVKLTGGWHDKEDEALEKFVLRQCNVKYEDAVANIADDGSCEIGFTMRAQGTTIQVDEKIGIKYTPTLCDKCTRQNSGYFEAIIQLRGSEEKVSKMNAKMAAALERDSFISKIKETKRGVDLYVGSKQVAAEAIAKFNFKPKISNKLHGIKDGQRIYRTTFSIRL